MLMIYVTDAEGLSTIRRGVELNNGRMVEQEELADLLEDRRLVFTNHALVDHFCEIQPEISAPMNVCIGYNVAVDNYDMILLVESDVNGNFEYKLRFYDKELTPAPSYYDQGCTIYYKQMIDITKPLPG